MRWNDVITEHEAAALCALWRSQGITSSHDLRARLTAEARRRRWWLSVRARWGVATGRQAA